MKKTELAKKLQISHSAISQWESKGAIPAARVFEIAPIIGVDAGELRDDPNLLFNKFKNGCSEAGGTSSACHSVTQCGPSAQEECVGKFNTENSA